MPQYPAPPPLRLPDGTLVPVGMQGTQYQAPPTQGAMPFQVSKIDPMLDFAPSVPSRNAVAGVLGNKSQLFAYQDDPKRAAVQEAMRPPNFLSSVQSAQINNVGAAPGSSVLSNINTLAGAVLGGIGAGIKNNPMGALNAALGIAGALQYATAKAPPLPGKPDTYAPTIRPAQGLNSSALETGRRGIQSAQTQVSRAVGADTGTTAVTRLLAQQQAGDQQSMLSIKDNEAFQADQKRVDDQTNQAYDANYKTQRSYVEKKYDLEQRGFEARRQQSGAMTQGAYQYFAQQQTGNRDDANRAQEMAEMKRLGLSPAEYYGGRDRKKTTATSTTAIPKTTAPVSEANGGRLPVPDLFARGGTLKTKTRSKFSFGSGSRARAGRAFEERMDAITSQALNAFNTTLREASNKRARGLSGK